MNPTEALLLTLHLLAAAFWVGGMAAMHYAVRPAAVATLAPPQRLAFMAAALARFLAAVAAAIAVLVASGSALIAVRGGLAAMPWSVHAMSAIAAAMIVIFVYIRFAPFVRLRRALEAGELPRAAAALNAIRQLVATNLALGTAVFVIAVAGSAA